MQILTNHNRLRFQRNGATPGPGQSTKEPRHHREFVPVGLLGLIAAIRPPLDSGGRWLFEEKRAA